MDFVKQFAGQGQGQQPQTGQQSGQQGELQTGQQTGQQQQGGGGFMDSINGALGGGAQGEAKEGVSVVPSRLLTFIDYLDKAVDFAQERMGGGDQSNESAIEQTKDEAISDSIRSQYKGMTGSDFPVADKS